MEPKTSSTSDVNKEVVKFRKNKVSVASQRPVNVELDDFVPDPSPSVGKVRSEGP